MIFDITFHASLWPRSPSSHVTIYTSETSVDERDLSAVPEGKDKKGYRDASVSPYKYPDSHRRFRFVLAAFPVLTVLKRGRAVLETCSFGTDLVCLTARKMILLTSKPSRKKPKQRNNFEKGSGHKTIFEYNNMLNEAPSAFGLGYGSNAVFTGALLSSLNTWTAAAESYHTRDTEHFLEQCQLGVLDHVACAPARQPRLRKHSGAVSPGRCEFTCGSRVIDRH